MRLWRPTKDRKPRSDSKLHGLAPEQRAMVDKWLFDKGLTYEAVSEACWQMFGLRVSKSSVGRYHERQAQDKVRRTEEEGRNGASGEADKEIGGWAKKMCLEALTGHRTPETEEAYQKSLAWMANWAWEEMQWPVDDERDMKMVLRFMRVLIASRRERNEADMAKLAREKFEMKTARECFEHLKEQEAKGQSKAQNPKSKVTKALAHSQYAVGLRRGEKDPMMVWNFPDGKIRRMPLLRRAEAATDDEGDD